MKFGHIVNDFELKGVDYSLIPNSTDVASFQPDSEMVRSLRYSPSSGESTTPLYDYNDGVIPDEKDDPVSDLLVRIRSGKYDKADIDYLRKAVELEAKQDKDKAKSEKIVKAMDRILGTEDVSESNE